MDFFIGVIIILVAHFVADFYFQPHDIAINKSHDIRALLIHIMLYMGVFCCLFFFGLYFFITGIPLMYAIQIAVGVTVVNSILHFVIDYYTSKVSKYFWQTEQWRNFFLTIGFDQLLHTSLLVYSYAEMLKNMQFI